MDRSGHLVGSDEGWAYSNLRVRASRRDTVSDNGLSWGRAREREREREGERVREGERRRGRRRERESMREGEGEG